ncbi:hypothetical protein [Chryseolinea soli]|uniref:Uncharacterized protein n=1 Tax=Chryseolinea soli TaxID=2321403 RepID=A0A385SYA6_9BACT|nr:hypothetical protein [Chryseolinea soli]AYB35087.1 hypothetical protein D4L85_32885 [Chryseolinea soli]
MKNKVLILIFLLLSTGAYAQKFEEVLKEAYLKFEKTESPQDKLNVVNRLDMIAARYSDQWSAQYYAAYAKVVTSYLLEDEKQRDGLIDQAEQALNKSKALTKTNEEILIMEAYIANARLAVKPMSRYKKYGEIFDAKLAEASALNAANPRIYFLKGQSTFHTPRAFGGGCKNALPFFEKAIPLFAKESKDDLSKPFWGHDRNQYYINECNE